MLMKNAKLSFKCILCIWAKMDTVLLCWVSNSIFEIIIHPVDRNLIIWLKQKLLAKDNFFFVDVSSNSFKITKLLIQSILNCKWITACVKATMSILNNKKNWLFVNFYYLHWPSVCSKLAGKMLERCCPKWFWHLYCRLGI